MNFRLRSKHVEFVPSFSKKLSHHSSLFLHSNNEKHHLFELYGDGEASAQLVENAFFSKGHESWISVWELWHCARSCLGKGICHDFLCVGLGKHRWHDASAHLCCRGEACSVISRVTGRSGYRRPFLENGVNRLSCVVTNPSWNLAKRTVKSL